MNSPWLSVIMPTFNGQNHIASAIQSIVDEEDHSIEVIVIDDGSQDDTTDVAQKVARANQLNLTVLKREHCGNWITRTNEGMQVAQGEYLCWLHQDDCWLRGRLKEIRDAIQSYKSPDWIVHPVKFIDQRNRRLGRWRLPRSWRKNTSMNRVARSLFIQNSLSVPGVTFRRQFAMDCGPLDEQLWYTGDWDYWLRFAQRSPPVLINRYLAEFRIHSGSQTSQRSIEQQSLTEQFNVILNRHRKVADETTQKLARIAADTNLALLDGRLKEAAKRLTSLVFTVSPLQTIRFLDETRLLDRVPSRLRLKFRELFISNLKAV